VVLDIDEFLDQRTGCLVIEVEFQSECPQGDAPVFLRVGNRMATGGER
jgi:hypothetical protein